MGITVFVHIANVLYLASYLVREIFVLRVLTVIAGLTLLPFYFWQGEEPLWAPILWCFVFTAVNVYQLIQLFLERRPVVLSDEDYIIYKMGFGEFTLRQFQKLLSAGEKKTLENNSEIVAANSVAKSVQLITQGKALQVFSDRAAVIEKGTFLGEISYVTENPTNYSVSALENLEVVQWEETALNKVLQADPELRARWQSQLSQRLAKRLS